MLSKIQRLVSMASMTQPLETCLPCISKDNPSTTMDVHLLLLNVLTIESLLYQMFVQQVAEFRLQRAMKHQNRMHRDMEKLDLKVNLLLNSNVSQVKQSPSILTSLKLTSVNNYLRSYHSSIADCERMQTKRI